MPTRTFSGSAVPRSFGGLPRRTSAVATKKGSPRSTPGVMDPISHRSRRNSKAGWRRPPRGPNRKTRKRLTPSGRRSSSTDLRPVAATMRSRGSANSRDGATGWERRLQPAQPAKGGRREGPHLPGRHDGRERRPPVLSVVPRLPTHHAGSSGTSLRCSPRSRCRLKPAFQAVSAVLHGRWRAREDRAWGFVPAEFGPSPGRRRKGQHRRPYVGVVHQMLMLESQNDEATDHAYRCRR